MIPNDSLRFTSGVRRRDGAIVTAMMTRRDVFKACAAGAILYPSVSVHAQAQQKRKAKTRSSISRDENSPPTDGQTDGWIGELLAGIRSDYHLPGFVGGIMKGDSAGGVGQRRNQKDWCDRVDPGV